MKFSEVVDALMEGQPISRYDWRKYMYYDEPENMFIWVYGPNNAMLSKHLDLEPKDIAADDWHIDDWDHVVDGNKKVECDQ